MVEMAKGGFKKYLRGTMDRNDGGRGQGTSGRGGPNNVHTYE
jgi:hypothetical protein